MNEHKFNSIWKMMQRTADALQKNNMTAYCLKSKDEVAELVASLIRKGDEICSGGSQTLIECGIIDLLKSDDYRYYDRGDCNTPEEVKQVYRKAFSSDVYFSSANAITENGELYNVDGNSNRVAAICYGPDSVIIIAGYNKIVKDINAAAQRVKIHAAPPNSMRLSCDTPCAKTGICSSLNHDANPDASTGCAGQGRICCNYVISAKQRLQGRIKVILVAEELGF